MTTHKNITVIGAGIVGISCALNLLRDGHRVTVLDRLAPGEATSFGNAGVFASAAVVPVPTPGILAKVPKLLFANNGALYMRWSYIVRMLPWLRDYLRAATPERVAQIADGLSLICAGSLEEHQRLAKGTDAQQWIRASPYLYAYESEQDFVAESYGWELRRERGFTWDTLSGDALRAREPDLAQHLTFAADLHGHGFTLSPSKLVKALASDFEKNGGTIKRCEVLDIKPSDGGPIQLLTDQGTLQVEELVIAGGAWSAKLLEKLGHRVPLESERGYHVMVENPKVSTNGPVMLASGKFVATPMADGMRFAGLVEFGGLAAPPSDAPVQSLLRQAKQMFPGIDLSSYRSWMGHRPSLPDSLPVIGPSTHHPSVHFAFGHQHIGLTSGPKTGRLIADLIAGRTPNEDIKAFAVDRF